jgi:hypothetical protein
MNPIKVGALLCALPVVVGVIVNKIPADRISLGTGITLQAVFGLTALCAIFIGVPLLLGFGD